MSQMPKMYLDTNTVEGLFYSKQTYIDPQVAEALRMAFSNGRAYAGIGQGIWEEICAMSAPEDKAKKEEMKKSIEEARNSGALHFEQDNDSEALDSLHDALRILSERFDEGRGVLTVAYSPLERMNSCKLDNDPIHLARAALAGYDYFVTLDGRLLKPHIHQFVREQTLKLTGKPLRIVPPQKALQILEGGNSS